MTGPCARSAWTEKWLSPSCPAVILSVALSALKMCSSVRCVGRLYEPAYGPICVDLLAGDADQHLDWFALLGQWTLWTRIWTYSVDLTAGFKQCGRE